MHDLQYRAAVAWQNVAYNQPPHTSYFIGQGMATPAPPNVYVVRSALPTVARAASTQPITSWGGASLSVLGSDDVGENTLRYEWTAVVGPGSVSFDANGTNASKATVARFTRPGTYTLRARITDVSSQSTTSDVTVAYVLKGDTNLDWSIDVLDVAKVLAAGRFNTGLKADWVDGDFNHDGVVDVLDVSDFVATGLFDAGPYA
jgi:hypothetical protein